MSKIVQIREVSETALEVMKARAAREGLSLSAYLRHMVESAAAHPTAAELLAEADELRAVSGGISTDDIVEIQREIRGE